MKKSIGLFTTVMVCMAMALCVSCKKDNAEPGGGNTGGGGTQTVATVTTGVVTEITKTTAVCGGEVKSENGWAVTERGVCWGTEPNPTPSDSHTVDGEGVGAFTSEMTGLEPGTKYYVRAYAKNAAGTGFGAERSFTTLENGGGGGERFSVSSTTTVEFSPGNLYWDGTESKFKFEENQWSTTPASDDTWDPSHVSHFFWSKTASVAYASSYSDSDVSTSDVFFTNSTETTVNPNFQVSGETAGTWRTLSKDEWVYLRNTSGSSGRMDANRFAKAMVNGVKGLLIFPDGYNGTAISGITGIATVNSTGAPYPSESIPTGTWASMESAGVVFLPAAGYRSGTSLTDVGSTGNYWSSSCRSSYYAYRMNFNSGYDNPQNYLNRYYGFSVRLVR